MPLTFGLPADDIRAEIADAGAWQQQKTRGAHVRAFIERWRNLWASRFIVRIVPTLERWLPWRLAECPICGWNGLTFRPRYGPTWIQPTALCPSCDGEHRHRLFALAYRELPKTDGTLPTVWIAPERCLRPMFDGSDAGFFTADIEAPGVDVRCDAEQMPFATGSIGLLVSNDVLEHVLNDGAALAEARRILNQRSLALFHVPIMSTETVEYGFSNEGEFGHRRAYGPDVLYRFEKAGFTVRPFRVIDLARSERRRYGLLKWDTLFLAS
jgi:hypothetical protein